MLKTQTIVPALRVNNRNITQVFLEETLGMKIRLEDAAFGEFSAHGDKIIKLVLIESPSMRTRAVKRPKKLNRIVIKADSKEIEHLLATGSLFTKLYKGKNGYAFEAISPEGDRFLLHGEENVCELQEILPPVAFEKLADGRGLSRFTIEDIAINTPDMEASQTFYSQVLPEQPDLSFVEAQGPDLLVAPDSTWDLDSIRFSVAGDFNWAELESKLAQPFFKDKKGRFIQAMDPSKIELWFEK
ncbi:chemotaxis protein [Streptococcus sp. X16XC17]|uniref:CppA N-terminal domain-containing protein n=1 Tax=unclassified Streptococcus TaxID=2608887 RepID=UPI00066FC8B0|nr:MULTISPECIES: CppA N-terminal domain-containing protein [unclassified Streptococcus]TCD45559.1 chemotaxis protein [Streptococcus sp. X16XC17]